MGSQHDDAKRAEGHLQGDGFSPGQTPGQEPGTRSQENGQGDNQGNKRREKQRDRQRGKRGNQRGEKPGGKPLLRGVLLVGREDLRSYVLDRLTECGFVIEGRKAILKIDVPEDPATLVGPPQAPNVSQLSQYDVFLTGWESPRLPEQLATARQTESAPAARRQSPESAGADAPDATLLSKKYVCHLTGTMREMVPRNLVTAPGWIVSNWGSALSGFVAEMTLALLLTCARRIPESRSALAGEYERLGRWKWRGDTAVPIGTTLYGKRLGLYGFGLIAKEFVRLVRPFGVRLSVYDPYADTEDLHRCGSLQELFADSDIVSIHCGLTPETERSVDKARLSLLPEDGIVINTARAGIIDEAALREAVAHSSLRFGLDVFHREPPDPDDPLLSSSNVVPTPHSAGEVGYDQYHAIWDTAVTNLTRFLSGELPAFIVDEAVYDRMT